ADPDQRRPEHPAARDPRVRLRGSGGRRHPRGRCPGPGFGRSPGSGRCGPGRASSPLTPLSLFDLPAWAASRPPMFFLRAFRSIPSLMPERIAKRLLIIGWDAADWKLIDPLLGA